MVVVSVKIRSNDSAGWELIQEGEPSVVTDWVLKN